LSATSLVPILRRMQRVSLRWVRQPPFSWLGRGLALSAPPVVGCGVAVLTAQLLQFTPSFGPLELRGFPGGLTASGGSSSAITLHVSPGAILTSPTMTSLVSDTPPSSAAVTSAPTSAVGEESTGSIPTSGISVSTTVGSTSTTLPAAINRAPAVVSDQVTGKRGTTIHIDVLANDFDIDGDLDPLSVSVIDGPTGPGEDPGSLTVKIRNGRNEIDYRAPSATGDFTFVYRACDASGVCGTASVLVTITSTSDVTTRPGRP
jgi:hypothetical protein